MLTVNNLTVRYGDLTVVDDLSFSVSCGEWMMILGPNGAGKSTALSAIMQGVPYSGDVTFEGESLKRMRPQARARRIGALMQNNYVGYAYSVEEVVRLGRYAYSGRLLRGNTASDDQAIEQALRMTGMLDQRGQSVLTLSGGELQRTFLAQVFAQNPRLLVLDEPTNHLDLAYQKQIFSLIAEWLAQGDRAVVSVVHDLSLARAYGTHAVLMQRGKCLSSGAVRDVFAPDLLAQAYDIDVYAWMRGLLGQWTE